MRKNKKKSTSTSLPCVQIGQNKLTKPWPDPTPKMLEQKDFQRIWECIKTWDINVPGAYSGYCGATGNHVRAILDAINNPSEKELDSYRALIGKAIIKWNNDVPSIEKKIKASKLVDPEYGQFKWVQLVWQEIDMWCRLGKMVSLEDFEWLCNRRGFDCSQRKYLTETLKHLNLWLGE